MKQTDISITGTLHEADPFNMSLSSPYNNNVSHKVVQETKTHHILFSVTFFRKLCRLSDNVGKYCRAGQATDNNMAHAHCMLDNYSYKHPLSICNIHCIATKTMVAGRRLNVTLYVHCVS
jgi:hypothetical protein